jgi:hypothetical protein
VVTLWNGQTGGLSRTSVRPGDVESSAAEFLPDGHTILVATVDGDVYALDTRLERWIDHACAVAGRNLTPDEWREVFGDRPYRETCPDL